MNVPQTVTPPGSEGLGIRVVYMLLFAVAFWIVCWALALTALMQLCVRLLNGRPSTEVKRFGEALGRYAKQVIEFLTFASEILPYPFTAWPAEA
ncbi:MAG TPA: DUF4389 domain-containing protein [Steroidobacteraceae bacterium]|nr:DUF4389 domain-containing protein [Steroidobacteraceae bacterium]